MKKFLVLLFFSFISVLPNLSADPATYIVFSEGSDVIKMDSDGNEIWTFTNHTDNVWDVDVDSNGFVYTASWDNTVRKIDSSGNQVWSFTGHASSVWEVAVDGSGNVYSGSSDNTVRKIDPDGNQIWSFTGHTSVIRGLALDSNGFVYSGSLDDTVRKLDSNGNELWSYDTGTNVFRLSTNIQGFIFAMANTNQIKFDSDGNVIWSIAPSGTTQGSSVFADDDGNVYSGWNDNEVKKYDSSGNLVFSQGDPAGVKGSIRGLAVDEDGNYYYSGNSPTDIRKRDSSNTLEWVYNGSDTIYRIATNQTLPLGFVPEAPEYNIELQTNTPYNDFIYQDDEINVITDNVITTILNDESFTVTSSSITTGAYTFNYWYDLDNMEVFTTNRNFTIQDPDRNYNLIADYTLNSFITFNIDSNLPTPKDFTFNTFTLENQVYSFNQTEFNNYQHPIDREWEIIAPTTNIGFYEFDYYYDNDNNEVWNLNSVITGVGITPPSLTAVYSLPEEYQINLTLDAGVGNIIFQHGENPPISGPFISQTIGIGDEWTATAPSNPDFQFKEWLDIDIFDIYSINQSISINNTDRNYNLRAFYLDLVDITWDSNGGTPIPQQTVVKDSSVEPPPEPTRPNFVFNRWEDSLGNPVTFPVTITEDVTFTADWVETYTLTYDTNGGGRIDADTYIENSIPEVVTPSRFGYEFTGWFTDDGTFQNAYDFTDPITQDTTIHAKWAFGSDRDAQLSLTTFLDDNDLGDGFSQIVIMITIYIFVNIIILIYQAPLIVTLILNFIVTSLFMILGWIAIWIVVVIFMSLFGLLYFFSSGRGITE